jgi:hypothetical protein
VIGGVTTVLTAALWIGTAFLVVAALVIASIFVIRSYAHQTINKCEEIKNEFNNNVVGVDIKEILGLQMKMNTQYHKNVLFRANLSFVCALVFVSIGILLFFSIIVFMGLRWFLRISLIWGMATALIL